jgi:hypothetical protein
MPGYQRALVVTGIAAILLAVLAGPLLALPVQGNLAITSGQATIAHGAFGDFVSATVAGPGFGVSFLACAEASCVRSSPGDPGRVIAPGQLFKPTVFSAPPGAQGLQLFDGGSATILGVNYTGSGTFSIGPNSILFIGGPGPLLFDATFASPPFLPNPGQVVTLSAPFHFTDELLLGLAGEFPDAFLDLQLSGQGQASITLFGGFSNGPICSPFTEGLCGWGIGNSTFTFSPAPIPEPATLVLLGTTLIGIGAAVRRRHCEPSVRG